MRSLIAAVLLLAATTVKADLPKPSLPPGQRYISSGTAGNFSTVTASTINATQRLGVSTAAPVWPLTVKGTSIVGPGIEGTINTAPQLAAFWNEFGQAGLLVRSSTEIAGAATSALVNIEAVGGNSSTQLTLKNSSGTFTNRALVAAADRIAGTLSFQMWTGPAFGTYATLGRIRFKTEGIPGSATNTPSYMEITTVSTGTASDSTKLRLYANGALGVGASANADAMIVVRSTAGNTANALFQDSSAVTLMSISSGGIVSAPIQPGTRVDNASPDGYSLPSAADTRIYWITQTYDNQDQWVVASSDTIRAAATGRYNAKASISVPSNGAATGPGLRLRINKNGTAVCNKTAPYITGVTNDYTVDCDLQLTAGDAITVSAYVDCGTAMTITGAYNNFSLQKLW